ncbi:MAG: thiamine-phosphate kinase [Chloroflexi bacterium]|nr:thiamine-phosphate kinase [Chloroflexota bacterium]
MLSREVARGQSLPANLLIGIGDDAAVWTTAPSRASVITTDALVEGVHFDLRTTTWFDLGWKSLAANISDIAAMGAVPTFGLITLGLPSRIQVEEALDLYRGMQAIGAEYGTYVVGGDTVASPDRVFINVVVWGETLEFQPDRPVTSREDLPLLLRSAAKSGDLIAVTGYLGTSLAGLKLLQGRLDLPANVASVLSEAHSRPRPRVQEGLLLVRQGVTSGMDISDGLLGDLGKICQASQVGAVVRYDRVPVHPAVREAFPEDYRDLALLGGEDYELLCAASPQTMRDAQAAFEKAGAAPLTIIGEITEGRTPQPILVLDEQNREIRLPGKSYEHFSPSPS